MTTQRLTIEVTTNTDQARLLDLLTAFGEVLADDLDDGDATFDEQTACVEEVPAPLSIPADSASKGHDDGGEGRMLAGMRDGNRGLADYGGLDLNGPGECGHHCDEDCPVCGDRGN